jgi:hypothetical protein
MPCKIVGTNPTKMLHVKHFGTIGIAENTPRLIGLRARTLLFSAAARDGGKRLHPSIFNAAIKACCGISTLPNCRIFFLPAFCFSKSLRLRVTSPP